MAAMGPAEADALVALLQEHASTLQNLQLQEYGVDLVNTKGAPPNRDLLSLEAFLQRYDEESENTSSSDDEDRDVEWLKRKLHAAGFGDLYESVAQLLTTAPTEDDFQSSLIDMLGYEQFDLATEISIRRDMLRDELKRQVQGAKVQQHSRADSDLLGQLMTREERAQQLEANRSRPMNLAPKRIEHEVYPHVYGAPTGGNMLDAFGRKYRLPTGTETFHENTYDEIVIPAAIRAPPMLGEKPVSISEMDPLCQETFKAYTSLNRIQSLIYPLAYNTSENMLICAPTGAGKTDVALLTILHTLKEHCVKPPQDCTLPSEIVLNLDQFKIVYVAPMKALAAEVVEKYSKRLEWAGVKVRELTGDMQLTKAEIASTNIIVTTPEKWDVVTRKTTGDNELVTKVRLIILDEVHMLHDDRGSVIESLVARTLRYIEATQRMIRLVGLSATLPNYLDVASFLRVNPYQGLFYFSSKFRPCPIEQHFIGAKGKPGSKQSLINIDTTCFSKVTDLIKEGKQAMIFVHSRKETVKTCRALNEFLRDSGMADLLSPALDPNYDHLKREMARSRNKELREMFDLGLGFHNAGMLRADRKLVEKVFTLGVAKVLVCTATLAWGVNLPAYAVLIKGTELYDPQKGSTVDLGILDVMQIFGRAGRPQFENHGVAYICTTQDKLSHYVSAITQQVPIESRFVEKLVDNLNAEIALGSVSNMTEAVSWLNYTYLYIRMRRNPTKYGITIDSLRDDPNLSAKRNELIALAARRLHTAQMVVFDEVTGYMSAKDLGRIASNFYISHSTIEMVNRVMKPRMSEADLLAMLSQCEEFEQLKSRENEQQELKMLKTDAAPCQMRATPDTAAGKVNILLQAYISRAEINDFALVSDSHFISQNASRIIRAFFEIALSRSWAVADTLLSLCKSVDHRCWSFEHPLGQFGLTKMILNKLETRESASSIEAMRSMDLREIGQLVRDHKSAGMVKHILDRFPVLELDVEVTPLTKTVLRLHIDIQANFKWDERIHGATEAFWIWVEDTNESNLYHSEMFIVARRNIRDRHVLDFTIPVTEPLPSQLIVRAVSDKWHAAETVTPVSLNNLILPRDSNIVNELLDLQPLPISALHNPVYEAICSERFVFFNAVQTQFFHAVYNTKKNIFVGAPTGSGKTMAAELALFASFRDNPGGKVVYVAPMKALVRERVKDWRARLVGPMGKKLIELTGDVTPDSRSIKTSDIIITTPEKWDGISRQWRQRSYVQQVALVIFDEIHLLGSDRGPILEMIVSRMNYIAAQTKRPIRILGLSTAVANAYDLADWLQIGRTGLFNFRHSVRPVPLETYIDGFPGRAYCPRMATMNRPAFQAIKTHSPNQPVLIFVSSRRQTRLTAQDLVALCGTEDNPRRFLHMTENELDAVLRRVKDSSLKLSLTFGIALHHAGLTDEDRRMSEDLFVKNKVQILIATSTLAWGVNTPAHLVIVKGTEYFDAKIQGYKDMDLTDVLQMLGRAGRPQYDTSGVARIFVQETKKSFYKHFLHSGFPVESSLHKMLADHLNAEIASGSITSLQDSIDLLTWTFMFRRLHQNPSYYGVEGVTADNVGEFLSSLIEQEFGQLEESGCVELGAENEVYPTSFGRICSHYYLSHKTVRTFLRTIDRDTDFDGCLMLLCKATEFDDLPVRHNEDLLNIEIQKSMSLDLSYLGLPMWDAHIKTYLLLKCHFKRMNLPVTDYFTDQITVLDQAVRIVQAFIDLAAELGYFGCVERFIKLLNCIKRQCPPEELVRSAVPGYPDALLLDNESTKDLEKLITKPVQAIIDMYVRAGFESGEAESYANILRTLPITTTMIVPSTDSIKIEIKRKNRQLDREGHIYAPGFPKPQVEAWISVLTTHDAQELLAIQRMGPFRGDAISSVTLRIPPGAPEKARVFVFCDGYAIVHEETVFTTPGPERINFEGEGYIVNGTVMKK